MISGIAEVASTAQSIYKTITYLRDLTKKYKNRFEAHDELVEEVDLQYLQLNSLTIVLERFSNGDSLDEVDRDFISLQLTKLGSNLRKTEVQLKTIMEKLTMTKDDGSLNNTSLGKIKNIYEGYDFVTAVKAELQESLDTSGQWLDSMSNVMILLLISQNGLSNGGSDAHTTNFYESLEPRNLKIPSDAPDTSIMRLVKRFSKAKEKALALCDLDADELQKQIIPYGGHQSDIRSLEIDHINNGGEVSTFKGTSEKFAYCVIDYEREFNYDSTDDKSKEELYNWLKETMLLAALMSSEQKDGDANGLQKVEEADFVQISDILPICVGVIGTMEDRYFRLNYIFQLPPCTDPNIRSLRTALTDPSSTKHPIEDRYRIALHLAQSLFLIHSAGIIHKQIRPESILLTDRSQDYNKYPKRLGRAFLIGYGQTRSNEGVTQQTGYRGRTKVYRSPRHLNTRFSDRRKDRYRIIDDIYSLGVCLLEIGLWTSLFKRSGSTNFEGDNGLDFGDESISPLDVQRKLIQIAKEDMPSKSGARFTQIVVSCLDCFNEELEGGFGKMGIEVSPARLLRKYDEIVLSKLRALVGYDSNFYSGVSKPESALPTDKDTICESVNTERNTLRGSARSGDIEDSELQEKKNMKAEKKSILTILKNLFFCRS